MSTNVQIGSGFSYDAERFLDERITQAKTKEDLLRWNKRLPAGFQVFVEGKWYQYDPDLEDPETGHFLPCVIQSLSDTRDNTRPVAAEVIKGLTGNVEGIVDSLEKLNNTVYPYSISNIICGPAFTNVTELQNFEQEVLAEVDSLIAAGDYKKEYDVSENGIIDNDDRQGWERIFNEIRDDIRQLPIPGTSDTYYVELGAHILPKITWDVTKSNVTWEKKGENIKWKLDKVKYITPQESSVVFTGHGITKVISEGKIEWISSSVMTSNVGEIFTLYIQALDSKFPEALWGEANFIFTSSILTTIADFAKEEDFWQFTSGTYDDIKDDEDCLSTFAKPGEPLVNRSFDCTGGMYPIILIPESLFSDSLKYYVGGIQVSDFDNKKITYQNQFGLDVPYRMIKTGYPQTAKDLRIIIK